jgi:DNA-directed RNA polymerase subunit RPC12/RpoP
VQTEGYRVTLERIWRQKVDEIVLFSIACHDDLPIAWDSGHSNREVHTDAGLLSRLLRAHNDLAMMEDAIERIDAGTYGICVTCERPMGADWLAETPYIRDCPNCSLKQLTWRSTAAKAVALPVSMG